MTATSTHHCGACGRGLIKTRRGMMHVLEPWDHDYWQHDAEPIDSRIAMLTSAIRESARATGYLRSAARKATA